MFNSTFIKLILFLLKISQTCFGSKFVAKSISSISSAFNIFLKHPPTNLTSVPSEKLLIKLKILKYLFYFLNFVILIYKI